MGKIVEKRMKKKGRPSLMDIQKRAVKEQQQQEQLQKRSNTSAHSSFSNYKSATTVSLRRSTRRNPNVSPERDHIDNEDELLRGKRREKKMKLVLKLPASQNSPRDSGASDTELNLEVEDDNHHLAASNQEMLKINAIGDGSGIGESDKAEKPVSSTNQASKHPGTWLDSGLSTPLPDEKLLLFILDRLQKKDTYGVFSEPVDLNELPDYLDVVEHPMDFSTVRKKLAGGVYSYLEQFEKDVFLICSNAMQYNAPDTIYFRQARSIQELAKKNFENLRQESDDNEPERKVVRRGRPPTKNFKKHLGRPSLERVGLDFSSDASLATGVESNIVSSDMRKITPVSDKSGFSDPSGQYGSQKNFSMLERNDDTSGFIFKGSSMKHGKKQVVHDENRRNTYKQYQPLASRQDPSVYNAFGIEMKNLMPIGFRAEYGYARSLARFASNLGPATWKIASKKIEKALPPGVKFGPGWVGENDIAMRPLVQPSPTAGLSSSSGPFFRPECPESSYPVEICSTTIGSTTIEPKGEKEQLSEKLHGQSLSEKPSVPPALTDNLSKPPPQTTSPSLSTANRLSDSCVEKAEVLERLNSLTGLNALNRNSNAISPRPPFQKIQSPPLHPGMKGVNGTYGFNVQSQTRKIGGATRPLGFNFQSSQTLESVSRANANLARPSTSNAKNSEEMKLSENSSAVRPSSLLPDSGGHASASPGPRLLSQPSRQGSQPQEKSDSILSPQQKPDSVPPDLNIGFQSPGSPSSSNQLDSVQLDLALQL
ncbi:hypothetical protein HS088_TW02G00012 [Tripterygium wilfordii]|uniref:Bromo domain-containing protein n=1 Tax=Tripterygium wilfordii TaxID=458696 RepID=A0A7J7DX99_TRIWF|nr:uncharacterized protein LOC120015668 [Tripterygium wilfordii]KAF5751002.1 hypothetical protein HS088_TW02G00012 [Tripterygium wilfordii]